MERIRIILGYEKNANIAYFDNISLVREAAQTMKYDDDGNLVSVTTTGLTADTNTYSGGNLIKTVTGGSGTYSYTYDTTYKHRLKSVTNGLVTHSMGYDGAGNVTSTTLTGSGDLSITTSATYGGSKNRLTSVTDAAGATITYGYGNANCQMLGLPSSMKDPAGTISGAAYDFLGRVTQTSVASLARVMYTYSSGNLETVKRTDVPNSKAQTYNLTYDSFGNVLSVAVGSRELADYAYNTGNGTLSKQTYANGGSVRFTYDDLGRIKTAVYSGGRTLKYAYSGEGYLHSITETGSGNTVQYLYTYDSIGRLISSEKYSGNSLLLRVTQSYDANNRPVSQSWQLPGTTYKNTSTYNSGDGSLATFKPGNGSTLRMEYDSLRRMSKVTGSITQREYTYRDISTTKTTTQIASISYPNLTDPLTFTYTYDSMGNIVTATDEQQHARSYTYDLQGQLLTETIDGTAYSYSYDSAGNILTAANSTGSHTYTYGDSSWGDLLTKYDGQSITYDAIGNPTSYYNGTRWTFGWANGRELVSATDGTTNITYQYDANGLRYKKIVDGVEHTYYYMGDKLVRMTVGTDTVMDFTYDQNGQPYSVTYNGTKFYYVLNLQGDVVRIVTSGGASKGVYKYDAWGNILYVTNTEFMNLNPLRYRGYVYDTETQLYYCQSRYYDPATGRFINADAYASTGQGILGNNMFAYCRNNPVSRKDALGTDDVRVTDNNDDDNPFNDAGTFFRPGGAGGGGSYRTLDRTTLYRSVDSNEAQDIKTTGKFNLSPKGMESKQFAFNYSETVKFGRFMGQNTVVSARIPIETLSKFDQTCVDQVIFRHGTLTVHKEMLKFFNELVAGTIEFIY